METSFLYCGIWCNIWIWLAGFTVLVDLFSCCRQSSVRVVSKPWWICCCQMVLVLKKEVVKTNNAVEHEDTGKYRQLLVRTLHQCSVKFADVAATVIPVVRHTTCRCHYSPWVPHYTTFTQFSPSFFSGKFLALVGAEIIPFLSLFEPLSG